MIISTFALPDTVDIKVSVWPHATTEPFVMRLANGNSIHLTHEEASKLHLQLTAALYEYEEKNS